jgi:hypothetical protein
MNVTYVPRHQAHDAVAALVRDAEVVLDLGSGIQPQRFVPRPMLHICVDAHRPYLERVRREAGGDPRYVFLNATWDQVLPMLPDKSVDSVFALDFIEHLEKEDGFRMLAEAQRVARGQVVVYTPNGFFPQQHEPGAPDRWGLDGGAWQTHRSGWSVEDFGEEWQFVISPDFIQLDEHNQPLAEPMGAIWALRNLAEPRERRYVLLERVLPPKLHRFVRRLWLWARGLA